MKAALTRLNIAVFIWGFTAVLGRAISLQESWLVWWRMCITTVSLWILFFFLKRIEKISFSSFISLAGTGTLLALHWLCFYGSIKLSNVSIALTCFAMTGLMSSFIEPIYFHKKINRFEILLGLFALAGMALIYMGNLHFSTGIFMGLISTFLYVVVCVINKKNTTIYKPDTLTLYQLSGGFTGLSILMPVYLYFFPAAQIMPQGYDWLWLTLLSWLCTIFTYMLYISALKKVSAFTVNLLLTLEPVYGIVLAFFIYHENKQLSNNFYWGLVLIFLAVLLQTRKIIKQNEK